MATKITVRSKTLDIALLVGGVTLLIVVSALWMAADDWGCTTMDAPNNQHLAHLYAAAARLGGAGAVWESLRTGYLAWPPAMHLFHGGLGALVSTEPHLVRMYGLLLLPLLAWATYRLAQELGALRRTAVLAALLTVFSFGVISLVREVSIDYGCTVVLTLCLLALVKARGFGGWRWTLLFGLACGLAVLVRLQVATFLLLPCGAAAVGAMRGVSRAERVRRAPRIGAALLLGLGMSALLWGGRLGELRDTLAFHVREAPSAGDRRFLPGLLYYGVAAGLLAGWPVLLTALATLPGLLRRRPAMMAIALALVGGWLGQSLSVARELRYFLPAVPLLALLAAMGVEVVARRRRELIGAVLLLLVAGPSLLLSGFPPRPAGGPETWIPLSYLRPPLPLEPTGFLDLSTAALRRLTSQPDGRGIYLIVGTDIGRFHTAYLAHRFPAAVVTAARQHFDSVWTKAERRRRRVLALIGAHRLHRKVVWRQPVPEQSEDLKELVIYELNGDDPASAEESVGRLPGELPKLPHRH
ncbi:MAG: glycosyltransferase family 39 protein [Deltaproteobacteria bacterium]|nr:glycosyltransferase family 39 protein [Deltaproteobacteria bacterium]